MSWRFRKTFKVFPGVKLNLTPRGLSATIGAAPFSLNVGPQGVYGKVGIPGTGIWARERLDTPSRQRPAIEPTPTSASDSFAPPGGGHPPSPSPVMEIRSASTESLGSESMARLSALLKEVYDEREALAGEISTANREATIAAQRYMNWERGWLFKRVFQKSFARRKEVHETAQAKCQELNDQLRLTALTTQIDIEPETAEAYYRMRDEFSALSESHKIWDTLERREVNRRAERSSAHEAVAREPVSFSLDRCDLIQWEQLVPHLPNRRRNVYLPRIYSLQSVQAGVCANRGPRRDPCIPARTFHRRPAYPGRRQNRGPSLGEIE
jgi:Protein of unknown function (DUF4236)